MMIAQRTLGMSLIACLGLLGCGKNSSHNDKREPPKPEVNTTTATKPADVILDVAFPGVDNPIHFAGAVTNGILKLTAEKYPTELTGSLKISVKKNPFGGPSLSPESCEKARAAASLFRNGPLAEIVPLDPERGAAKSKVRSEAEAEVTLSVVPFFASLTNRLSVAARQAGFPHSEVILTNPLEIRQAHAKILLNNNATSNLIGELDSLEDEWAVVFSGAQTPLGREEHGKVFAYDLLCDIQTKKATIQVELSGPNYSGLSLISDVTVESEPQN